MEIIDDFIRKNRKWYPLKNETIAKELRRLREYSLSKKENRPKCLSGEQMLIYSQEFWKDYFDSNNCWAFLIDDFCTESRNKKQPPVIVKDYDGIDCESMKERIKLGLKNRKFKFLPDCDDQNRIDKNEDEGRFFDYIVGGMVVAKDNDFHFYRLFDHIYYKVPKIGLTCRKLCEDYFPHVPPSFVSCVNNPDFRYESVNGDKYVRTDIEILIPFAHVYAHKRGHGPGPQLTDASNKMNFEFKTIDNSYEGLNYKHRCCTFLFKRRDDQLFFCKK
jgi:hypothetical protein